MEPKKNQYKCTNVAFAAYLEMNGHHHVRLEIVAQGKGIFYYDIDSNVLNDLKTSWNGSPEAEFSDRLNRLKSITY